MRIAVITSSYPGHSEDPAGHFVRAEVRSLIAAGHVVTLLVPEAACPRDEPRATLCELPHRDLFGWPGALARSRERPWRLLGLLPFARAARQKLKAQGPFERVIAHWIVPAFWPICRDFVAETVVVVHGSDLGLLERLPPTLQRPIVLALSRDNVTLRCVSMELAARMRQLSERHGMKLLRVRVEPAMLELPTLPTRQELRRELGLTAAPMVVIVGRAVKDKRVDLALDTVRAAIALAALESPPSVVVIGDGPERASLMPRFPEISWLGQLGRSDTLRHIRAADLLVSASLHEGAPTAIREARSLGTEVVAARAGDLGDWACNDDGLLVVDDFSSKPRQSACELIAQCLCKAARAGEDRPLPPRSAP
jgi:teichuronic acid biosynthesis glycosyltransferase TuaC